MESTLQTPALVVAKTTPNAKIIVYWIATALFCLQMSFTAYAQLSLPQVAEMFAHLGFPDYFRVELSWAKLLGVALLLAPVPARLKEWAYAGFAITLASALIAHFSLGDGPEAWSWAAATGVLWGLWYFYWRRLQATPGRAPDRAPPANEVVRVRGRRRRWWVCHHRSELPTNQKRLPLAEVAGYAERQIGGRVGAVHE